jgi:hypothetical protein
MFRKKVKKINLLFLVLLIVSAIFEINLTYSVNWFKRIQIQNFSSLQRTNVIVPIDIPNDAKGNTFKIAGGSIGENLLPIYVSKSTKPTIFTQISLKPNEEKTVILSQDSSANNNILSPCTEPGTEYLFVNYKSVIIVSTEALNSVSFFSADGKMLNSDQKPLVLGKGKWFVLESSTPKLTRVLSEKPIYIFSSTLKEFTSLDSVEPGDSDTTTLYGQDLFFFTEKHLFISAYEKTKAKLLDSNDIEVWSGTIESNRGIFQENLKRGAYHLVTDQPVTIQFGYLDDENFSVLYGQTKRINAYTFGDLMISSLYSNTKVTLQYGNEKITKQEFSFKQAGISQIVSLIEQFSPKNPEYMFVSISFNNPIQVFTYSSGNNFGGEYIPGKNGLMADCEFSFVTLRVSKEFSKEQKNLIELIGIENNTNIEATGAWKQKIVLQERSTYTFSSNTPLEKINLTSDKPFQVSQIHNYNTKGLFYWIPPIHDSSIQIEIGDQNKEGMIQNSSVLNQNLQFIFNKNRFNDFLIIIKTPAFILITMFFSTIFLLLLFLLFLVWFQFKKSKAKKDPILNIPEPNEKELDMMKLQLLGEPLNQYLSYEEESSIEDKKPSLPLNLILPNIALPVEKEKNSILLDHGDLRNDKIKETTTQQKPEQNRELVSNNSENKNTFLSQLQVNKIVLDPGSANRLYIEGKLIDLPYTYIVKSSSKKITGEVSDKMNKVDLNMQDMTKANVYKDSLSTFEEAGKALSLCKKLKIIYYISSYKLPSMIQGIHVIHISDALKSS